MLTTYTNTYLKRVFAYLIATILILLSVLPTALFGVKTFQMNGAVAETLERVSGVAFDLLNEILSVSEAVITENQDFFLSPNNTEYAYVDISKKIRDIKNDRPYVDRIVFYKRNDNRLLTDIGTVQKDIFFSGEYLNETYNMDYWENMMQSYVTPAVVPASTYGDSQYSRRLFVIPNIYYVYNVGILFFVNEERFIDYCGYNSGGNCRVSFYNARGEYLFGNGDGKNFNIHRINNDKIERVNLLGNYEKSVWFNYDDMIFQVKIRNPILTFVILLTLLGDLLVILLVLRIIRQKRANLAIVTDSGISTQTMLYACMKNGELLAGNIEALNQAITAWNDSGFALYAAVFHDVEDRRRVPGVKAANQKLPNSLLVLEKIGNVLILFANIPYSKRETVDQYVREQISPLTETLTDTSAIQLVSGNVFTDFAELPAAYTALRKEVTLHDGDMEQITIPETHWLKKELHECIARGEYSVFMNRIRNELDSVKGLMPCYMYNLYLAHIYFTVAESFNGKGFVEDTYEVFLEGIKANEYLFNPEASTNMLLNVLSGIRTFAGARAGKENVLSEALDYIKENYKRELGLNEVAERVDMEAKNFSMFFKRHMNTSFMEYVTHLRMEEAKRLLIETDKSVREVYEEVGYFSGSSFTMMFKKKTGESPSRYRSTHRK